MNGVDNPFAAAGMSSVDYASTGKGINIPEYTPVGATAYAIDDFSLAEVVQQDARKGFVKADYED